MSLVLCTIHSPEQKTESAKNSLDSMSKLFFNPSECNKLHPPSHLSVRSVLLHFVQRSPPETRTLYKGGKKVYLISTGRGLATLSTVWRRTLFASFFIQIQNVSKAYSLLYRLRYSKGYSFSKYEPKRL